MYPTVNQVPDLVFADNLPQRNVGNQMMENY